jgi:hypothetical protein
METIDDDIAARSSDYIKRQAQAAGGYGPGR